MKNGGPKGAPGFPEWGQIPIPPKLLKRGINDVVRISGARIKDGDEIVLDVAGRRSDRDLRQAKR